MPGFFRIPVASKRSDLYQLDASKIYAPYSVESDAYDHWMLGGSPASLVGRAHNKSLTAIGNVNMGPSYSTLKIGSSTQSGYQSDITDSYIQTQCAIVRISSAVNVSGMVGQIIGAISGADGAGIYGNDNSLQARIRPGSPTVILSDMSQIVGKFAFIAMSESSSSTTRSLTAFLGGGAPTVVNGSTTSGGKSLSQSAVGVGQITYPVTQSASVDMDVAEYILYQRALTAAELTNVYLRAKSRMERRGLQLI